MDRRMVDRAFPLGYALLVVASAMFFPVALAGIAIIGALVLAGWYSVLRPTIKARERERAREQGEPPPYRGE